jgi:subtilase family serine protease
MRIRKGLIAGLFIGIIFLGAWILFWTTPAWAAGETCANGQSSIPNGCAEDVQMNGCTQCHSLRVTGGNRNGTDRIIEASPGTNRHIDDPRIADWTLIVDSMISKGSTAILELTAGYLNTNYNLTSSGPILGSPLQSSVTSTSATVTWSTSYNGWEDEPTDTVLFYGTDAANVLNCTSTAGCSGVSVAMDSTPVAHHVVNLAGLSPLTKYYMVNQATSVHGTTRSTYAPSFKTKPNIILGGIPPKLFISEDESGTTPNDRIIVIDPNPTVHNNVTNTDDPNPNYNKQIGNVAITGQNPAELASHPDSSTVYATVGNSLSVIDAGTNTELISLLAVGDLTNHVAVSADGKKLYLAYRKSSGTATLKIKVYDVTSPADPALTTTISDPVFDGCYAPLGLAVKPDSSQLYLACRTVDISLPDRFYMVDTATNTPTLTATFPRDGTNAFYINAFAVKPDGSQVYVARADTAGSTVEIFDGATGANAGSIPLPANSLPRAGVVSPDGSRLYVVDLVKGIHVIDAGSNTLLTTMLSTKSRGFDIGITPDGARLYTTLLSVFVNNTATNSWLTTITGDFNSPSQLTMTPGRSGGPPLPDVVITTLTPNGTVAVPHETFSVTDTVKNQGSDSTLSGFNIGYRLSPTANFDDPAAAVIATTRYVSPLAVGATDSATTSLAIPWMPTGNYYLCAKADMDQALAESNPDNNAMCSAATILVTQADLIMTNVTPNASSAAPGGGLSVTDTVQNQGGAASSGTFIIAYSLSLNSIYGDEDDLPISTTRAVGPLAAGASNTATTNLAMPPTIPPNNYHVCAKTDSSDTVIESNETNNTLCSAATIGISISDLIMSAVSTTTTAVAPSGSFPLSNTAKNVGSSPAGAFTIAFHLSVDQTYGGGDDIVLTATRSVSGLGAGATSAVSTSLTVPAATPLGPYYVCALADSANTVVEGDEGNNSLCTPTQIQVTRPDLLMTAVTPNAATVSTTATLSVTNTVKNQGTVSAGSFTIAFKLSLIASYTDPGAIAITTTRTVSSLAAGVSNTATTTLAIPKTTPPNNYYVCANADSANTVVELDEGNNTLCSPGTVTVPPADLIISAVSTTTTAIAPGKTLSLSNSAKNQGLFPAGSFTIAFHLSTDATYGGGDDSVLAATRSVTSLASAATSTGSTVLTIPAGTPFGVYYLCAMADSGTTVNEGPNEGNNTLCTATTVQVTAPDLILTAVSTSATTVNKGTAFSVSSTVGNTGALAAGAFRIAFHLSPNLVYGDGDDVAMSAIRSVTSLGAGASSTGTTSLTVPTTTPSGIYYVCAMADSIVQVLETNESNNTLCSTTQITVP